MRNNFMLLVVFSTLLLSLVTITTSTTYYQDPRVEVAQLKQNGSLSNPYIYNLTLDYSYVTKMIWALDFVTNLIDFDLFDGNTTALTNGINVMYNGQSLVGNDNITANHQFMHFGAYDSIYQDAKNPKGNVWIFVWQLTSFIPDGLQIDSSKTIQIYIQDDLTGITSLSEISCTIEGYKNIDASISTDIQQVNPLQADIGTGASDIIQLLLPLIGYIFVIGLLAITFWKIAKL